ncbi:MAG: hypothetical protein PHF56_15905 [Desulfuromonadaceae bacterium]|nr:hypothetical protein [Desulfuromonadaceae bacterium]
MELAYEYVSDWFDRYFETVSKVGMLETVPTIGKFFCEDFEFIYYSMPPEAEFSAARATREELVMQFIHPGLCEVIKPEYKAIDLKHNIVAVKFFDQIISATGGVLGSFFASAYYHIVPAEDTGLKIRKLEYWTETQSPESVRVQRDAWLKAQQGAYASVISDWLQARY